MSAPGVPGHIQTVCGPLDPAALGPTLLHEHVFCDLTPPEVAERGGPEIEVTLENVWEVRYHWFHHLGNQRLTDEAVAARELTWLRAAGGEALVELTCQGIRPNPVALQRVSAATGVAIVMGAGYYVEEFLPADIQRSSLADMTEELIRALTRGAGDTGIQAGIIGEMGCSWPWTDVERRAMRAAVAAQAATGASIQVHPGRHPTAPLEIIQFIAAEGGLPARTIIGHMDRTIFEFAGLLQLARTGCVLEYDFFGIESSYYPFSDVDLPNDGARLALIQALIREGFLAQIVISQDICTRTRLRTYGGHGYGHVFANVVPMMRRKSFGEAEIEAILVENPRRLLALA